MVGIPLFVVSNLTFRSLRVSVVALSALLSLALFGSIRRPVTSPVIPIDTAKTHLSHGPVSKLQAMFSVVPSPAFSSFTSVVSREAITATTTKLDSPPQATGVATLDLLHLKRALSTLPSRIDLSHLASPATPPRKISSKKACDTCALSVRYDAVTVPATADSFQRLTKALRRRVMRSEIMPPASKTDDRPVDCKSSEKNANTSKSMLTLAAGNSALEEAYRSIQSSLASTSGEFLWFVHALAKQTSTIVETARAGLVRLGQDHPELRRSLQAACAVSLAYTRTALDAAAEIYRLASRALKPTLRSVRHEVLKASRRVRRGYSCSLGQLKTAKVHPQVTRTIKSVRRGAHDALSYGQTSGAETSRQIYVTGDHVVRQARRASTDAYHQIADRMTGVWRDPRMTSTRRTLWRSMNSFLKTGQARFSDPSRRVKQVATDTWRHAKRQGQKVASELHPSLRKLQETSQDVIDQSAKGLQKLLVDLNIQQPPETRSPSMTSWDTLRDLRERQGVHRRERVPRMRRNGRWDRVQRLRRLKDAERLDEAATGEKRQGIKDRWGRRLHDAIYHVGSLGKWRLRVGADQ